MVALDDRDSPSKGPGSRLQVRVASDWPTLVTSLVEHYRHPFGDEFATELIVSPGPGHDRALTQALATALPGPGGICAGFALRRIGGLRADLEATLLGLDADHDPWQSGALPVAVLDAALDLPDDPSCAILRRHLQQPSSRPGRRLSFARRTAKLFASYGRRTPQLLHAWSAGTDIDSDGQPLPEDLAWQPRLWRAVTSRLADWPNPAERHHQLMAAVRQTDITALPNRIGVVQIDAWPVTDLELLTVLADRVPVDVWVLGEAPLRSADGPRPFWQGYGALRELAVRQWATICEPQFLAPPSFPNAQSLLHRMQTAIRTGQQQPTSPGGDDSFQIHACHGPDRQVEVLREVLCGLFEDHPELQPRDVVVLCTDLDAYAALLDADLCLAPAPEVIARGDAHPGQGLRVQISGDALAMSNPLVGFMVRILQLPSGRADVGELLSLCGYTPVARRFGFSTEELASVTELLDAAHVVWGLDRRHRRTFGVDTAQGTWSVGIDRLIAGVAMAPDPPTPLGTILGVREANPGQLELIGRLAEAVSRIRRLSSLFTTCASLAEWVERIRQGVGDLCEFTSEDDWQLNHLSGELASLLESSGSATGDLVASDMAELVQGLLQPWHPRGNFGNGALQVCRLGDLEGVSQRVICVLGLDDEHFPPAEPAVADDALAGRPAEPALDSRLRGRAQLLNALLAAQDAFIVITRGGDERTGELLPPSVPIVDLLEACAVQGAAGRWRVPQNELESGIRPVVQHHTMQPHSWSNFSAEDGWTFSFDRNAYEGARELVRARDSHEPTPGWAWRFPTPPTEDHLELKDLTAFFRDPADQLLRKATGYSLTPAGEERQRELPLTLGGLAHYVVGTALVTDLLEGKDLQLAETRQRLEGWVPPGELGSRALARVADEAISMSAAIRQARGSESPELLDRQISLTDCIIHGRIRSYPGGLVFSHFGSLSGQRLVEPWLSLLMVAATSSTRYPPIAWLVTPDQSVRLVGPPAPQARVLLQALVQLRRDGLVQLLPLPPSLAFSAATGQGDGALQHTLEGLIRHRNALTHFGITSLAELRAARLHTSDPRLPGTAPDASRFDSLTRWFFQPVLQAMTAAWEQM